MILLRVLLLIIVPGVVMAADEPAGSSDPFSGNACVQCHQDLPGRLSEIVHLEWSQSVHYHAAVGCDGCHGGDPTVRPDQFDGRDALKRAAHRERDPDFLIASGSETEFVSRPRGREVSYFCGKCHADIKEKHLGSPHGDFGAPTCLYCHGQGSHRVTDSTPQIIDTRSRQEGGRCAVCHTASTMQVVAQIRNALIETEALIETSGQQYQELEQWGYRNLTLEQLHHHAAEMQSRLRQTFHSFSMRDVSNFSGEIQAIAERTAVTHDVVRRLKKAQREQTIIGILAVVLLLTFACTLVYYKHAFLEAGHQDLSP